MIPVKGYKKTARDGRTLEVEPYVRDEPDDPIGRSYDRGARRKSQRSGRDKGIRIFIPAEELVKAGYDPDGPPPAYRVWAAPRGRVCLQLYKEQ